jgi:hypothetical protein
VVYETGETEELCVDEVVHEGIMSLGWAPAPLQLPQHAPQHAPTPPLQPLPPQNTSESAGQLSVAGVRLRLAIASGI